MEHQVDARGFLCPIPSVWTRAALGRLAPGDTLVVLATDPEAPVDIGALALDHGYRMEMRRAGDGGHWRLELAPRAGVGG